ncbi:MAG: hypothetical protein H6Q05_4678 [Acidobacteria bacterium]|jgi:hypothetical protein|nr:hypothetical protein [Acidobacteriota bacterium]
MITPTRVLPASLLTLILGVPYLAQSARGTFTGLSAQLSEDFSLIKHSPTKLTEGANSQIRMGVNGFFNRTRIADPLTSVSDMSSFGRIFGKTGGPRAIQLGPRTSF